MKILSLLLALFAAQAQAASCDAVVSVLANKKFDNCSFKSGGKEARRPLMIRTEDFFSIDGKRRVLVSLLAETGYSALFLWGDPQSKVSCESKTALAFENSGRGRVAKSSGSVAINPQGKPAIRFNRGGQLLEVNCN